MRFLVCSNAHKGFLSSLEVCDAIAKGLRSGGDCDVDTMPIADGGDGTLDVLVAALGGEIRTTQVSNALGNTVAARYGVIGSEQLAIIEMAEASGMAGLNKLQPMQASSFGVGQLVMEALNVGCKKMAIGLGGSATMDGGAGMAQALGYKFLDSKGTEISAPFSVLDDLGRVFKIKRPHKFSIAGIEVIGLADVKSPLLGPQGQAFLFGPQKGATGFEIQKIDKIIQLFSDVVSADLGIRKESITGEMTGAAGGLGFGLMAFLGARLVSGASWISETVGFISSLEKCDCLIVGEGCFDNTTMENKGPFYLASLGKKAGKKVVMVAGRKAEKSSRSAVEAFDEVIILDSVQKLESAYIMNSLISVGKKIAEHTTIST